MVKMLAPDLNHGMAHRAKIIDQGNLVDSKPLGDHRRPDDPGVIGELQHFASDGAGDGYCCGAWQSTSELLAEGLPCGLQACMVLGLESDRLAEALDLSVFDIGKSEPRMASADIGSDQLHHNPAALSIAEAPRSALSTPYCIIANSSRPVPNGGGGAGA